MMRLSVAPQRWTDRSTPVRGRAPRVLVVDDSVEVADGLATYLGLLNVSVRTAYDGRSALVYARAWHPDVILLDISMPEIDGYTVARELRGGLRTSRISIVALTAHDGRDVRGQSPDALFDAYCQKGLVLEPITQLISTLTCDAPPDDFAMDMVLPVTAGSLAR